MLLRLRPKTTTNPVFYPDRLRLLLEHDPERLDAAFNDPGSVDLLTWNVFASLSTDPDRDYLAALLRPLGGTDLTAPVSVSLWTGRHREPILRPSSAYRRHLRQRLAPQDPPPEFLAPIEVPVRVETPQALVLVDTALDQHPRGAGGRDRIVELIDAGLVHVRRVQRTLAVAVVYRSGSGGAAAVAERITQLSDAERLGSALPWLPAPPQVQLRAVAWQALLATWEGERDHFRLSGQPVRAFLEHCSELGLR